jgi:hypothetical protein
MSGYIRIAHFMRLSTEMFVSNKSIFKVHATGFLQLVDRHPIVVRWILAGPGMVLLALSFTAAMPVWSPTGGVALNGIAYPMVLAPLVWIIAFVYAILSENLVQCGVVMTSVLGVSSVLAVLAIAGWFG